jgi:predicted DNA-binding transcriptional regulator AlpA
MINSSSTGAAPGASTPGAANPETKCGKHIISNPILPQARIIEPLLKAPDVAKLLNVSRTEAYRLMRSQIPTVRFGATTVRVRMVDLEDFINSHRPPDGELF